MLMNNLPEISTDKLPEYLINRIIMFNRHPSGEIINIIIVIDTVNDEHPSRYLKTAV